MWRHRFITAMKIMIEKNMESLSRFHSANTVDSYSGGRRGGKKKEREKNTEETTEQVKIQE